MSGGSVEVGEGDKPDRPRPSEQGQQQSIERRADMSIQDFHAKLGPQNPTPELIAYKSLGQSSAGDLTHQTQKLEWAPWPER